MKHIYTYNHISYTQNVENVWSFNSGMFEFSFYFAEFVRVICLISHTICGLSQSMHMGCMTATFIFNCFQIRARKTIVATTATLFNQHSSSRTIEQHAVSAMSKNLSAQVTSRGQQPRVTCSGRNPVASSCPTVTIQSPRHVYRSRG